MKTYFSSNLSYLRATKRLTQTALGKEIGLSKQIICLYESGAREPSVETLLKVSDYFGVLIDDLLKEDLRPTGTTLSRNLKYLRKREGYRQEDMARLLGYKGKQGYSSIENGISNVSIENLVNISEYFGVTVDDLLKKDLSKEEQV